MRSLWARALLVVASILLAAGTLAGVLNHEVLDGQRFAAHADGVRRDAAVSQLVGVAITDRVIEADQELVALRPAIEAAAVALVRSPAFTPVVEASVRQVHEALTTPGSDQLVLRLADFSAVVVAALKTLAPNLAAALPPNLDITLADFGGQRFATDFIHLAGVVSWLAWLLPLLALACLAAALALSRHRQRELARAGLAITAAGALVALASTVLALVASSVSVDTLSGALSSAAWDQLAPAFWRAAVVLTASGLLVFAAAGAHLPQWSIGALARHAVDWVRDPGPGARNQLLAGALLVVAGACALLRPLATAQVLVVLLGLAVLAEGVTRISRVSAAAQAAAPPEETDTRSPAPVLRRRWAARTVAVVSVVGLMGFLLVAALPADRQVPATVSAAQPGSTACNGHVELCARPYDQVANVATHNAMSAADEEGWFIAEQPTGLIGQLDAGVRALLIDAWYGQETQRSGVIVNAAGDQEAALALARNELGPAVVDSATRLRAAANLTPRGPVGPYLCHAVCALGSTPWVPAMTAVAGWLAEHPREVVTFIVEDYVSAEDTAAVFEQAGLLPYVHTQAPGQPWPTLGQLVDSGQQVVVFLQSGGGGPAHPWLHQAWDWIQDTPYDNASQSALSCARLRGTAGSPLLLVNNFLNRFDTRVADSSTLNAFDALWPYAQRCEQERGQLPNFVAVDFFDKGDVFGVVNRLNGVS